MTTPDNLTRQSVAENPLHKLIFGDISTNPLPVFCFPELIEKLPVSLTYCFIYMLGCVLIIGCGYYFYLRRILFNLNNNNGHSDNEPDIIREFSYSQILRRLFCSRSNTEMREIPHINGGESGEIK